MKTKGRPETVINWPLTQFTAKEIQGMTGLSEVSVYNRLKKALQKNLIQKSGKRMHSNGRPENLFEKVVQAQNKVVQSVPVSVEEQESKPRVFGDTSV